MYHKMCCCHTWCLLFPPSSIHTKTKSQKSPVSIDEKLKRSCNKVKWNKWRLITWWFESTFYWSAIRRVFVWNILFIRFKWNKREKEILSLEWDSPLPNVKNNRLHKSARNKVVWSSQNSQITFLLYLSFFKHVYVLE